MDNEKLEQFLRDIIAALQAISSGGASSPSGLEGVSMALAGEHLKTPLGDAVGKIGDGLNSIADSIDGLVEAVRERAGA